MRGILCCSRDGTWIDSALADAVSSAARSTTRSIESTSIRDSRQAASATGPHGDAKLLMHGTMLNPTGQTGAVATVHKRSAALYMAGCLIKPLLRQLKHRAVTSLRRVNSTRLLFEHSN